MRRATVPLLVAVLCALCGPSVANAYAPPAPGALDVVGVGDQHLQLFSEKHFRATGIRRVRYFVPWNAIYRPDQRQRARTYVRNARNHGVNVLMHVYTEDLRVGRGKLPSPHSYERAVAKLIHYLAPFHVRAWGVWNEANHKSEPTWQYPRRAAQYYAAMRRVCRGCRIVALDVLDTANSTSYIDRFYAALSPALRRRAKLVGIHNYVDVNRGGFARTQRIIDAVRRWTREPRFWLTETGGIVYHPPNLPCSDRRAAQATNRMFDLIEHFRGVVDRAYVYNWLGTDCQEGFDAGLLTFGGQPRSAYGVLRRRLAELHVPAAVPRREYGPR